MRCKKELLLLIAVFMVVCTGCKKETGIFSENDFRVGKWGDPLYLIQKNEYAMSTYEGESRLMYWDSFLGYNANITYIFYDNKLNNGYVKIESDQSEDDVFNDVVKKLSETYGTYETRSNFSVEFTTAQGLVYVTKAGETCNVLFSKN